MQQDFAIPREAMQALQTGAVLVPSQSALFHIEGPGALDCLQGLLTNDVIAAGEQSLSYGGILTNKGMILLDPFVARADGAITLILPEFARELALGHLARVLPPRLARVEERTGKWSALCLLGARMDSELLGLLGSPLPGPGHLSRVSEDLLLAKATPVMPFAWLVIGGAASVAAFARKLERSGAITGGAASLAAARVLGGWPALGSEIDEKTLPQEVRYDELGAVSYSKGCYTGQETVARVHFRGHANRALRGAILAMPVAGEDRRLFLEEKEVGVLRTTVSSDERILAMATVRREVPSDAILQAGQGEARLVPFPVSEAVPA